MSACLNIPCPMPDLSLIIVIPSSWAARSLVNSAAALILVLILVSVSIRVACAAMRIGLTRWVLVRLIRHWYLVVSIYRIMSSMALIILRHGFGWRLTPVLALALPVWSRLWWQVAYGPISNLIWRNLQCGVA